MKRKRGGNIKVLRDEVCSFGIRKMRVSSDFGENKSLWDSGLR
jgi:hypothetical protein